MSKEKDFRDSLSALPNEQPRPSFPADEDVLGKMDKKTRCIHLIWKISIKK